MSPARLDLRIEMRSDWQVGTGTRVPGGADDLVARDPDGLPWVPAKTLAGIWRDACEAVAAGLDADGREWGSWVRCIFGDQPSIAPRDDGAAPGPARLQVSPGRFPAELRELVAGPRPDAALLRRSFTFLKPGVAIDPASGRAREDHFRLEEVCRAGAVLQAECDLDLPDEAMEPALALLAAGAVMVERLGGRRRRGSGRCRWTLSSGGAELDAVSLLEAVGAPGRPPAQAQVRARGGRWPDAADGWWRLPLRIELTQPVVVAERVVGNVTETMDHVPGAMLLPWIASTLDGLDVDSAALVHGGRLRVLPAYPEVGTTPERGIPVPLAFALPKQGGDLAVPGRAVNRLRERAAYQQLRDVPTGVYVASAPDGQDLRATQVQPALGTHNTIEDTRQRPTTEVGGVYSYQAIPAGTVLRSELLLEGGVMADLDARRPGWWRSFSGPERLGRARKDAYGRVRVSAEAPMELPGPGGRSLGDTFTVLLESDLLLVGPSGRPATGLDALVEALAAALDVPALEPVRRPEAEGGERLAFTATRRYDGWQTAWRLPRPSLVGIAAGACALLRTPPGLTAAAVARLQRDGLGARRAEGFGRLRMDDPLLDLRLLEPRPASAAPAPSQSVAETTGTLKLLAAGDPNADMARAVERVAWRASILRAAAHLAASARAREQLGLVPGQPGLTRAQVGGLRGALRDVDRVGGPGTESALRWLDERGVLPRVVDLLKNDAAVWELLDRLDTSGGLGLAWPMLLTPASELRTGLWAEAVRVLVGDAAAGFAREHRQARAGARG